MEIGKLGFEDLNKKIIDKIKFRRKDVLLHSGIGEDSAVVDFGEEVLVISSDPITGAAENAGYIAVHVTCNDLAATGAKPVGIQVVLLLPDSSSEDKLSKLMTEIHDTAAELDVEILGGHTEILSTIEQPLIISTGIGKTAKDSYVPTGGAQPGDDIILTKGLGIEGIYILATDYSEYLQKQGISNDILQEAHKFGNKISVITEGLIAASMGANSLHDITEGGLYGALQEMSIASNTGFEFYPEKIEIADCTKKITDTLELDPCGLLSSGSLLISISEGEKLVEALKKKDIKAWIIGNIRDEGQYISCQGDLENFTPLQEDEFWRFIKYI